MGKKGGGKKKGGQIVSAGELGFNTSAQRLKEQ
jgi:hypothetical protein